MKLAIRGFLGEIPRLDSHLLPDRNGSVAINAKNFRGSLEPFLAPALITTLSKVGEKKAIYRFGQELTGDTQYWFHWLNDTDVARGPTTGNDTEERTYYTESGQPMRMTDSTLATGGSAMPVSFLQTGLPAPGVKATVSLDPVAFTFGTTSGVDGTNDLITITAHGLGDATPVTYSKQGGSQAIGLTDTGIYYVRAVTADAVSLYPTVADANADTNKINLTPGGAETHKLTRGAPYGAVATQLLVAYAYVNSWGHEGPVSVVSDPVNAYGGETLNVSTLETGPIGAYVVPTKRLYVAQSDVTGRTVLRFWKDLAVASTSTSGVIDFTTLGAAAPEPAPIAPPSGLISLRAHPNGFMVGIDPVRKRLCRSEVFKPYAWPDEYQDPLDDVPIGCEIIGSSVVVGTKGPTYLATGNDPLRLLPQRLEGRQPQASKRSMQLTNAGVIYSSPDGLVAVGADGRMELATRVMFTRDQWQAYNPASHHAVVHDERYFLFWKVDSATKGLMIFDFTGDGLGIIHSEQYATAAFSDPRRDALFFALEDGNLHKWDAGLTFLTMRWRSKRFLLQTAVNFGAARIVGDYSSGRTLTLKVYGDDVLRDTVVFSDSEARHLDRSYTAHAYEFEIEGAAKGRELLVAQTMFELARG